MYYVVKFIEKKIVYDLKIYPSFIIMEKTAVNIFLVKRVEY